MLGTCLRACRAGGPPLGASGLGTSPACVSDGKPVRRRGPDDMPKSGPGVIPGRSPSRDRCRGFVDSSEVLEVDNCLGGGGILLLSLDAAAFPNETF